jgi:hypothetical protein
MTVTIVELSDLSSLFDRDFYRSSCHDLEYKCLPNFSMVNDRALDEKFGRMIHHFSFSKEMWVSTKMWPLLEGFKDFRSNGQNCPDQIS